MCIIELLCAALGNKAAARNAVSRAYTINKQELCLGHRMQVMAQLEPKHPGSKIRWKRCLNKSWVGFRDAGLHPNIQTLNEVEEMLG